MASTDNLSQTKGDYMVFEKGLPWKQGFKCLKGMMLPPLHSLPFELK